MPADRVPPTTVATTSPGGGTPRAAKNITGTVVSSSSSMMRGLVSPTYAATTSRTRTCAVVSAVPPVTPSPAGVRRHVAEACRPACDTVEPRESPSGSRTRGRGPPWVGSSLAGHGVGSQSVPRQGCDLAAPDPTHERTPVTTSDALPPLDWTELDERAVDTVRVLAMDAVQKVGNGHPGTAMSLAPAAYLLFQKVMRHNPADPHWPGRDRFVLSCGHSSLTLYIQLYLGGLGLELDDLKALRTWGSQDAGPPRARPHRRRRDHHRPARPGRRQRRRHGDGRPPRARPARPGRRRGRAPVRPPRSTPSAATATSQEGVSAEASSLAGVQQLGNLRVIYDANQHLDRGRHRRSRSARTSATRYEAYGWHVQNVDWTHDGTELRRGRPRALRRDPQGRRRSPTGPASSCSARSSPGRRPTPQNTGKRARLGARRRRGRGHQGDPRLRPRRRPSRSPDEVIEHTRRPLVARGKAAQAAWDEEFAAWAAKPSPSAERSSTAHADPQPARRLGRRAADVRGRREGRRDPQGLRRRSSTRSPRCCPSCGAARPTWPSSNNTTIEGRAVVPAQGPLDQDVPGRPLAGRVLHFGIREHAMGAIMNGIALHGGTRVFGGTFLIFSDYMRPARSGSPR